MSEILGMVAAFDPATIFPPVPQSMLAEWVSIEEYGPPACETFVLCWDGKETFVDWFGSKPDAGRGVTHWIAYELPPGATSEMHDGRRAVPLRA